MVRNAERVERGRSTRPCAHSTKGRNGESPVLLDDVLTERSTEQMRLYMQKEGWFQAQVTDTVHFRHRRLLGNGHGREHQNPEAQNGCNCRDGQGRARTHYGVVNGLRNTPSVLVVLLTETLHDMN